MISNKVVVFDFDGTLIAINSFKLYLIFIPFALVRNGRFYELFSYFKLILLRMVGKMSHLELKVELINISVCLKAIDLNFFVRLCMLFLNKGVLAEFNDIKRRGGAVCCLLSAAPYVYLSLVADKLGFDYSASFGGVTFPCSKYVDHTGWRKIDSLRLLIPTLGNTISEMFTDHSDDLPLLLMAERRVLVAPTVRQLKIVKEAVDNDLEVMY